MRIKIGVGEKPNPEYDLADWVLSRFTDAENKAIAARFDDIKGALEYMIQDECETAMNRYSS